MLSLTERQLRSWEKDRLIPCLDSFAFSDLIALRTLAQLKKAGISTPQIRRAVEALRDKLSSVDDPLRDLKIFSDGRKITVLVEGSKMEPVSGQLLLDFDRETLHKMLSFPRAGGRDDDKGARQARQFEAVAWFERALELEQTGAPVVEIIAAYEKAIALDPKSAGALVNLGTVYFHQRKWDEAEGHYRKALEADPSYALAHFNLGNLYDEKGDRSKAFLHYLMAIRLNPSYGDAHYNLALLYQSSGQALRAVRHWRAYLKIDTTGPWAAIARQELEKLRRKTILTGSKADARDPGAESVS
jgi:tetratricopeptide (TPR) repeat protein